MVVAESCNCEFRSGGCAISDVASPGKACKCVNFHSMWGCGGEEVSCSTKNPFCAKPDQSIFACILGKGDCDGYFNDGKSVFDLDKKATELKEKVSNVLKKAYASMNICGV